MGVKPRGRCCVVHRSSRGSGATSRVASCQELPANPAHALTPRLATVAAAVPRLAFTLSVTTHTLTRLFGCLSPFSHVSLPPPHTHRLVATRSGTSTSRNWTGSGPVVCRRLSHPCCGAMRSWQTCCRCVGATRARGGFGLLCLEPFRRERATSAPPGCVCEVLCVHNL